MNGLVLVIGDFTKEQEDLVLTHLREKGILARLVRCPEMATLGCTVEDARKMAEADDNPRCEQSDFYHEAFIHRTGYDLSKVVAVVITEAIEDAFYRFTGDYTLFFGDYDRPVFQPPFFIIRPQPPFWIDEK